MKLCNASQHIASHLQLSTVQATVQLEIEDLCTVLSDAKARNAKPRLKPYKVSDGQGLYLFVRPTGSKQWRFDYAHNGKRKTLTVGAYPYISLLEARKARDDAKRSLAKKLDPCQKAAVSTFKKVAEEWLLKLEREGDLAPTMAIKLTSSVFPYLTRTARS